MSKKVKFEELFYTNEGNTYKMFHYQDCCESVTIDDINGDLYDLIDPPIEMAIESTNSNEGKDDEEYCGDSITLQRADEICKQLKDKGFASSNIVFGVGSYTYQYNTRDTFCQAMKATYAVVNNEERLLFKDPVTDNGTKKSQRGLVVVVEDGYHNEITYVDGLNSETIKDYEGADLLEIVFKDGKLIRDESLLEIRERLSQRL